MLQINRIRFIFFVSLIYLFCAPSNLWAQAFPSKPITIIVPYPPGGLIDMVARVIQQRFALELGQPVVIENKSGAGGNVGAEAVVRSTGDGYTLLLANPSLGISPHIYPKLSYKPLQDFAFVGMFGTVPNVLLVNPLLPAKNVTELIALAKKNPGKLNYASNGFGTSPQMSMELFKAMTDTFIVHIPFRGSAPALTSILANETQIMFDNIPPQLPHIKAGTVKAFAVTSLQRSPALPGVPTLDELGLKGYQVTSWFGLVAPSSTPREVVARLNQALNATTRDPKVNEVLVSRGATVIQGSSEEFANFVKAEIDKWGPVVKRIGVVAD
ncbi:MAG: tripartite tricarboxylate transporter substrate binding protein [Betaproteobacteria bacterium]|jgi:tripartite-type tricarboxylate transporter receptor subunit TctC